ncbi:hypothetical protein F7Q91_02790 [Vibrio chagasii]|uniref:Uncharacterized protein n=1 Tax=Vibrio chagasii TaxID=170679 RepID=A0A7V7TK82_9VIBR|nr:hypothetical protein [Vibrio chagasii]KAB0482347.1 hypothetical protein F7Q91_02790 [Vibrio chagasii]
MALKSCLGANEMMIFSVFSLALLVLPILFSVNGLLSKDIAFVLFHLGTVLSVGAVPVLWLCSKNSTATASKA